MKHNFVIVKNEIKILPVAEYGYDELGNRVKIIEDELLN
jgi:hypothetical protein